MTFFIDKLRAGIFVYKYLSCDRYCFQPKRQTDLIGREKPLVALVIKILLTPSQLKTNLVFYSG